MSLVLALMLVAMLLVLNVNARNTVRPGCQDKCGNITIPYPFGTTPECYLNKDFFINCTTDSKPFLRKSVTLEVSNITDGGEIWVGVNPAYDCYNGSGETNILESLSLTKFFISDTRNKFVAVGCDAKTMIQGLDGGTYATGCITMCYNISDVEEGSCSGVGCCETPIPRGILDYKITVGSYFNHTYVTGFNPCSYAFVVADGMYSFSSSHLGTSDPSTLSFPVVLDWTIGNETCKEVGEANVCRTQSNSECYDSGRGKGTGYRCRCREGYDGNPYLSPGCQDINECENPELHNCRNEKFCTNFEGGFNCSCYANGTGCTLPQQHVWIIVVIGTGAGAAGVLICITWIYCGIMKWKAMKLKEMYFKQNGGLMLQQGHGSHETSLIFTEQELKKATSNYDETKIVGRGGFGTVFKGTLSDGRVVAIKKSKVMDPTQKEQFINEMIILSKINHRNVVKLLGFCLETQVPLLVYEFVSNGTLSQHIHDKNKTWPISWEVRLRIAAETAGVLYYLHSAASVPIIHRDVKTTNILLDENYTAKVSDFGASRLVPQNQDELSTMVQGTIGYMDPEYLLMSQFTEKSDVYSFGIVLMELLTGQEALSFKRPEGTRNLAMYFISALKEDGLFEILAENVRTEDEIEKVQVQEVVKLAKSCIRMNGEERPSMREVAMELEGLRTMVKHSWASNELQREESEYLLGSSWENGDFDGKGNSSSGYDSIRNHIALSVTDAR